MKKKVYIAPELIIHLIQLERMVALSKFGEADPDSVVLSKGNDDWDIWGNGSDSDYEDDYDY